MIGKFIKGKTFMDWAILSFLLLIIIGLIIYQSFFNKPQDSVQLYEKIAYVEGIEQVNELMVAGFEDHFKTEDITYIQRPENTAQQIRQVTLFEYEDRSFVITTTPGTKKLEVYAIEELPEEMRAFFTEMAP